jgi:hypothetical protein
MWVPDSCPKIFLISISNSSRYSNSKVVPRGIISRRTKNHFQDRGLFKHGYISLGYCSLYMQTIFEKCPFRENGKLSIIFRLILRGLNLPVGSDTPQNKVLRGIRRCRTRSCEVSDPFDFQQVLFFTEKNISIKSF